MVLVVGCRVGCVFALGEGMLRNPLVSLGPQFPPEFRRPGFGEEVTPHVGGWVGGLLCRAQQCLFHAFKVPKNPSL